ncbi:hypothetical protein MSG28_004463 [Choristoneura fumiferana]|uniref:Uncharacterized protein n=1 Tax=Choristoneura fumiferana TaxID=7141 RepID=A0ACC0K623_CHOFU|nr:hypothetical protein MSG28_004463 [Choristoneura fumiferana]
MPCDTRLLVITPNWPNITLRRSSVMSGGKLLMYRLDSVSGLWDALFSGLSSAKDTLSVLPCISRPLKAARAFSASSCFSYSTKPYPRFAISLQLSILPIAENNAYIISRVISSDKELLAQTIKRRYSFHLSSYLQLELGAISMLAHMHIMVLMESMVSGHKFISIRERLADKLELLRFDPYSICVASIIFLSSSRCSSNRLRALLQSSNRCRATSSLHAADWSKSMGSDMGKLASVLSEMCR